MSDQGGEAKAACGESSLTAGLEQLLTDFAMEVAKRAIMQEREACAKVCEAQEVHGIGHPGTAFKVQGMCIDAIRARSNVERNRDARHHRAASVDVNVRVADEPAYLTEVVTLTIFKYNPKYGDERVCKCGHRYYRHFDSYEDMDPVGCKYCECRGFEEAPN